MNRKERAKRTEQCESETFSITSELLGLLSDTVPPNSAALWSEYEQVSALVDRLMDLQKDVDAGYSENRPNDERRQAFTDWCSRVGVKVEDGLRLEVIPGFGWGVVTDRPLTYGTRLVDVPRKAMLTVQAVCRDGSKMRAAFDSDPVLREMNNVALTMCVAYEKVRGRDSFWRAYLDVLPASYHLPLFFSVQDMALLKGCSCFDDLLKLHRSVVRQYAYFRQRVQSSWSSDAASWFRDGLLGEGRFTFRLYRWAVGTVMTRINFVPTTSSPQRAGDGAQTTPALIPFLDMFNHADVPQCSDFDQDVDAARVFAAKDYAPGEQVFIFYGPRANRDLFLHNGFIRPAGSIANQYELRLSVAKGDKHFARRAALLRLLDMRPTERFVLTATAPSPPPGLLLFAAVFAATPSELDAVAAAVVGQLKDDGERQRHVSTEELFRPETLVSARRFLEARLKLLLTGYASSLQAGSNDDGTADSGDPSSLNRALALRYVHFETSVLRHHLDMMSVHGVV